MGIVSEGVKLNGGMLRAITLLGGDTNAVMSDGTDVSAATRGKLMLARYMAPVNRYYEQWHGRALHALALYATSRRMQLHTYKDTIAAIMTTGMVDVMTDAWDIVGTSLLVHNRAMGKSAGLPGAARRFRFMHGSAQVAVGHQLAIQGAERYKLDYDDAHRLREKIIGAFAGAGQTSVDMLGSAIDYSGQLVDVKASRRQYDYSLAKFNADKDVYRAQQKYEASAAKGALLGKVLNAGMAMASTFMGGK